MCYAHRKEDVDGAPDSGTCAICLRVCRSTFSFSTWNIEVVQTPCKHTFHHDCLSTWLEHHRTCPTCRAPLSPIVATPSTGNYYNASQHHTVGGSRTGKMSLTIKGPHDVICVDVLGQLDHRLLPSRWLFHSIHNYYYPVYHLVSECGKVVEVDLYCRSILMGDQECNFFAEPLTPAVCVQENNVSIITASDNSTFGLTRTRFMMVYEWMFNTLQNMRVLGIITFPAQLNTLIFELLIFACTAFPDANVYDVCVHAAHSAYSVFNPSKDISVREFCMFHTDFKSRAKVQRGMVKYLKSMRIIGMPRKHKKSKNGK